jgi:mono/diheme cytochrome c family protein
MINDPKINSSNYGILLFVLLSVLFCVSACNVEVSDEDSEMQTTPHVMAKDQIEAGRYLVTIGGCNDCHTDGYLQSGGNVPEKDWLLGTSLGWQGEWGTTYPSNLRLTVQDLDEEEWVLVLHERTDLPPMPWMNVNKMSELDAKAIYHYIRSLGAAGDYVPEALNPGEEPQTPYLSLIPKNLPESR